MVDEALKERDQSKSPTPTRTVYGWGWGRWAWRTLTSMRTAVILLALLALAAIPGSFLPQRNVATDPAAVPLFYRDHPTMAPWLDRLFLFDVYASPWFAAVYLLLLVSMTGCVLPRCAKLWQECRAELTRAPTRLSRMDGHRELSVQSDRGSVLRRATEILSRRGYRVVQAPGEVRAEKGYWHIMRGEPRVARLMDRRTFGRTGPRERIRGRDFAGTVAAVGPDVTRWRVGDPVLGEDDATFAEHAVVPESCLARKPEPLSFEQAAALPLAACTADLCLTRGGVAAGHRVLVIGASGGVGTFAVQLAAVRGATVTGVCRTGNVDLVRSLGAVEVVDYTREDFSRRGASYDVVLDLVGNRTLRDLRRVVAPSGALVLSGGGNPGEGRLLGPVGLMARAGLFGRLMGLRVEIPSAAPDAERLADLAAMAGRREIRPVIERSYPLHDAAEAMRRLEVEHARGKIVVTM